MRIVLLTELWVYKSEMVLTVDKNNSTSIIWWSEGSDEGHEKTNAGSCEQSVRGRRKAAKMEEMN